MNKPDADDDFAQLVGQMNQMVNRLWQWHFGEFSGADSWQPPVNVYQLERRLEVCVDLAGVDKQQIDVRVEPGRLVIRGFRQAPHPDQSDQAKVVRILSMEIDHGPFCRIIHLPEHVELAKVESQYVEGMLWIRLPFRKPG